MFFFILQETFIISYRFSPASKWCMLDRAGVHACKILFYIFSNIVETVWNIIVSIFNFLWVSQKKKKKIIYCKIWQSSRLTSRVLRYVSSKTVEKNFIDCISCSYEGQSESKFHLFITFCISKIFEWNFVETMFNISILKLR